ncbi:hypothetical protein C922_03761 [Plasmodium inui San Antonio 1]|uniref:Uncharacterized protein n=1 Tax=Plasmodium inui San Antonio 1 TaxID=1237626 RepID=W7A365_9APIC|nr:hypothetical protein C922_03761 [Plasmodium inui San Antonio 1]EUD65778.1 hypothetical protein C922_03761 [Plasmodium inui San Antonio 1]
MTIEDVKRLKPYWNVQIANFKEKLEFSTKAVIKGAPHKIYPIIPSEPVFTLLQMAILLNKKTIVGYLLARRGLDINALSRNNQTALMIACEKRVPLDWIEAILKKGGDLGINIIDNFDETALDKCGYNSKAYQLLLKYGAIENVNHLREKHEMCVYQR